MRSKDSLLRLSKFRLDDIRRQISDTEMMIDDLMRKHDELDGHMKYEEQRTSVSDPTHVNYSMAAKALRGRRDNIVKTVAELKGQIDGMREKLKDAEIEFKKYETLAEKDSGEQRSVATV